jgi:hypothetical protein
MMSAYLLASNCADVVLHLHQFRAADGGSTQGLRRRHPPLDHGDELPTNALMSLKKGTAELPSRKITPKLTFLRSAGTHLLYVCQKKPGNGPFGLNQRTVL